MTETAANTLAPAEPPTGGHSAASGFLRFYDSGMVLELTERLIRDGMLTEAQLGDMQSRASLTGKTLDSLLFEESAVDEKTLVSHFSELSGIPFRNIGEFKIDPDAIAKVHRRSPCVIASSPCRFTAAFCPWPSAASPRSPP